MPTKKGMSINPRKRPSSSILDDSTSNKRPKIGDSNDLDTDDDNLLDELSTRSGNTNDLPAEKISLDDSESESESDESESDESGEDDNFEEGIRILKDKDPELYASLQEVNAEIERTEPNVFTLLKNSIAVEG